ncbi:MULTISPECIES: penicillin-binding protein 1A [Niastella]|uniref:Transglycosylase domain-containing protein n=1 Tax=Niastella soli TaxID=2821487 RepID=A0ABS3YPG0_9BACT|nr:transglycosylase domain-containing protein [Niastella soli]MBO9199772.1 transglycosylase domain-containing protein [Niastella soli]
MKKGIKIFWWLFFIGITCGVLLIVSASIGLLGKMPSITELSNPTALIASQVYAEDGSLMGKYLIEDRIDVEFKDISPQVINALVATEDERFYSHNGIDGRSLMRSLSSFGTSGGASTITMQTAKNLFTDDWATSSLPARLIQKIKEAIIAVRLERNFSKEEIITLYLNTVAFSDNVYGIRNASSTFFQKEPSELSTSEAAVLVGMLKGNQLYNPRRFPERAKDRRNVVLHQMVRSGFITEPQATALGKEPIKLNYRKLNENTGLAPYFRAVLGEELKKWCKEHENPATGKPYNIYKDGLRIYTTINPVLQMYAEQAVARHMPNMQKILNGQKNIKNGAVWKEHENILENAMKQSDRWKNMKKDGKSEDEIRKSFKEKTKMTVFAWNDKREIDTLMSPYDSIKYCRQMLQAGFMAMDPQTGAIKAWVGGVDFKTFKFDHANIGTKRQVGSTIKPLLYGLAINDGGFTPATPVEDVQQNFEGFGPVPATNASCSNQTMPMAEALAQSRNCATAYIMKNMGNKGNDAAVRFVKFLKTCGVTTDIDPVPAICLGSGEISLYEMLQAYSMFPAGGFSVKPMYITRIEDKNGNPLQVYTSERKEVISASTAYNVITMMQGVINHGTGVRTASYGINIANVAGKTGTTNDNSDAWFMGYTPQLLCGVWTGCDDRFIRFSSTSVGQGASLALPVWAYFYANCLKDKSTGLDAKHLFVKPQGMVADTLQDWSKRPSVGSGEDNGAVPVDSSTNSGY